ncbi:hypothetical protein [Elizabethkingia sp. JS20170427COW]|uniref:hypothetical protein n=1 Tax=Elizabethkingia sp. JS20170427COW TaxID=2583851 RepID=UPI0011106ECE|nr:hypothetical protein [Elizabethkingia sp. JS20170427COW]QCX53343.1 hypothetical protein FGE20_06140 [Elizabethkingia sp. JS20170427COW]
MKKTFYALFALAISGIAFAQTFRPGTELQKDRWYNSSEHNHSLIFQNDGNLVVYNDGDSDPIWSSNTKDEGARAIFQRDGNLVVYDYDGNAIFSSNTSGRGAGRLTLQSDGNLVIYSTSGSALWSSRGGNMSGGDRYDNDNSYDDDIIGELARGTRLPTNQKIYSRNKAYFLTFQRDGNLAFYRTGSTRALWASNTQGRGARAEFQNDGNLVIYDVYGNAIFSSRTNDRGDNMSVQNDGNVVIYDYNGNAVWSSNR